MRTKSEAKSTSVRNTHLQIPLCNCIASSLTIRGHVTCAPHLRPHFSPQFLPQFSTLLYSKAVLHLRCTIVLGGVCTTQARGQENTYTDYTLPTHYLHMSAHYLLLPTQLCTLCAQFCTLCTQLCTLPTHYLHITYTLPTHYLHITYTCLHFTCTVLHLT